MANNLTNYAEAALLKWAMTDEAVTRPTAWYVALFSTATDDAGGGTELTGSGYAREAVDFGATGATSAGDVTFEASGGDWLEATHMAIYDAASAGNMWWHGPLVAAKQIDDGDTLTFPAGDIDLALD